MVILKCPKYTLNVLDFKLIFHNISYLVLIYVHALLCKLAFQVVF